MPMWTSKTLETRLEGIETRLEELAGQLYEIDVKLDAIVGVLDEFMTPAEIVANVVEHTTPQGAHTGGRRKKH